MPDGVDHDDAIQQSSAAQTTETQADAPHQTTQTDEAPSNNQAHADGQDDGAHPLEPGGERFKQVWARAKDAEFKLQSEREAKARLEGELEALKRMPAQPTKPEPEYTWTQLQAGIDAGTITMAQALEHREGVIRRDAERKAREEVQRVVESTSRVSTLQQEMEKYKAAVPEVVQLGTPERQRVEKEFAYLVSLGYDAKDPRAELLALRAAFGDPDIAKQRKAAQSIHQERETMQDTTANGAGSKQQSKSKDVLTTLTPEQKRHYERMIERGMYPKGWDDIREELAFVPPR